MGLKVLVNKQADLVTAHAVLFPNVVATGTDEEVVLAELRLKLEKLLKGSRLVELELESAESDPWQELAGMWANDKDWDTFQTEVKAYRNSFDTIAE